MKSYEFLNDLAKSFEFLWYPVITYGIPWYEIPRTLKDETNSEITHEILQNPMQPYANLRKISIFQSPNNKNNA